MTPEMKQRIEQIQRGEVPEGYQKTSVGIIPAEWKKISLRTVLGKLVSGTSVNSDKGRDAGVYILKTSSVSAGTVNLKECKPIIEADFDRVKYPVLADSLIISRMNTPALVGECGYVGVSSDKHYLPDCLWQAHNTHPHISDFR